MHRMHTLIAYTNKAILTYFGPNDETLFGSNKILSEKSKYIVFDLPLDFFLGITGRYLRVGGRGASFDCHYEFFKQFRFYFKNIFLLILS